MTKRALVVVDVQPTFCEGGELPVEGGNAVAQMVADVVGNGDYRAAYDVVVTTQDWHEPDSDNGGHISDNPDFVDTWPAHGIQGTANAELHPAIQKLVEKGLIDAQFKKGQGKAAYSGFEAASTTHFDDNRDGVSLDAYLKSEGITAVDVCGIATDYCVKATAVDAVKAGYATTVLYGMTAAVGGRPSWAGVQGAVLEAQKAAQAV